MPLDGTNLRPISRATLRDVADDLGIEPVSVYYLLAHKQAELKKHPGNLLYHHQIMVQEILGSGFIIGLLGVCATIFGSIVALVCGSMMALSIMLMTMLFSSCLCCASMLVMFLCRVKEPAQWVESIPETLDGIPAQLGAIAMAIRRHHVGSYLVVGSLIQNEVLLDPYLTVRTRHGDEIVIGIWDDEKIIASATRL